TSPVRMLVIFALCRATGCWQQECEAGIADDSQLCAIFLQQVCSSAVICLSGTLQTIICIAATALISRTAANFDVLPNIPYLKRLFYALCPAIRVLPLASSSGQHDAPHKVRCIR